MAAVLPNSTRAIKAAHKLQLSVDDYEITPEGAIRIRVRNYKVDPDGTVHVLTVPRPVEREHLDLGDKLENLGLPLSGKAA